MVHPLSYSVTGYTTGFDAWIRRVALRVVRDGKIRFGFHCSSTFVRPRVEKFLFIEPDNCDERHGNRPGVCVPLLKSPRRVRNGPKTGTVKDFRMSGTSLATILCIDDNETALTRISFLKLKPLPL
jgi:hypothetical protein